MCTLTVEYCLDGLSEEQKTTASIFYCQTTLTVIRDTNEVKPALSLCFLNSDGTCSDTGERVGHWWRAWLQRCHYRMAANLAGNYIWPADWRFR